MKNYIYLYFACLFIFFGCHGLNTPYKPSSASNLDPILSEDRTDESIPASINFSDNIKNFDPENPDEDQTSQDVFDQALDFCNASQEFWQKGDIDNALQSLDQAYSIILNIDSLNSPQLIKQKEDLRYMISKRILEIYASQNTIVNGTHKAIPIIINKEVQYEIDCLTHQERNFFEESLKRSGRYRPMIVKMLKDAGIPAELSWLPLVESGFKVNALSKARALGLWQFIPSTGYMYGLSRDIYIDERLDPKKSTIAAIDYLKKMHNMFGDWSTVLAAYNCGEGRVLSTIRSQKINYLDNFWDLYSKLPLETARYVPRFIATVHIVNNLAKYGFDKIEIDSPASYETVTVSRKVKLKDIADSIDESESVLKDLNPELRYGILPGENYALNIPVGKTEELLSEIDSLDISAPVQNPFIFHRVKFGETLSTISKKYNISSRSIVKVNRISRRNFVDVGKIIKIPQRNNPNETNTIASVSPSSASAPPRPKPAKHKASTVKHIVKNGESLWIIAKKYGTTVHKIKAQNKVSTLKAGQVLAISTNNKHDKKINPNKYCVKHGDNTSSIAMQHNMKVSHLLQLNKLTANSKIHPGQKLLVE
jgi:membrane-bound lytic murein transglycosylase D